MTSQRVSLAVMSGLLISVRDADEAATALAGGADLLDVKEPSLGSLGAASPTIWREVLSVARHRVPTSVALGELLELREPLDIELLARFDYAKLGLAGCGRHSDWNIRWASVLDLLPPSVIPVAVIYADWQGCDAPAPQAILRQAAAARCGVVLFDTHTKTGADLFTHIPPAELGRLVTDIQADGLLVVLGGSLRGASIARARDLGPNYIAVRAAACRDTRTSAIDLERVQELSARIRHDDPVAPS